MFYRKDSHANSPRLNRLRARYSVALWRWRTQRHPVLKRAIDICASLLVGLALSPIWLIVAFCIKAYDQGPVFFWQRRIGKHGMEFNFPKFRSMRVDAERVRELIVQQNQHGSEGITFKMKGDPRITPVGKLIRRFSIDELPQLWCVFRGDMSLVGPRPALVSEVARYSLKERARLSVTPGLTCIWQVSGRSEISFPEQVEMDIAYIRAQSLTTDVKLLVSTVPAVVGGRGAY